MLRLLSLHEESVLWLGIGGAGFLVCAYLLLLALVISFCILGLTPRRKCIFSTLGKNSLSVYLLQAYYIVIMTFVLEKLPLISPREPLTAAIISAAGGLLLFGCTPVSRAVSCLTGSHLPLLAQKMKGNRHVRN